MYRSPILSLVLSSPTWSVYSHVAADTSNGCILSKKNVPFIPVYSILSSHFLLPYIKLFGWHYCWCCGGIISQCWFKSFSSQCTFCDFKLVMQWNQESMWFFKWRFEYWNVQTMNLVTLWLWFFVCFWFFLHPTPLPACFAVHHIRVLLLNASSLGNLPPDLKYLCQGTFIIH